MAREGQQRAVGLAELSADLADVGELAGPGQARDGVQFMMGNVAGETGVAVLQAEEDRPLAGFQQFFQLAMRQADDGVVLDQAVRAPDREQPAGGLLQQRRQPPLVAAKRRGAVERAAAEGIGSQDRTNSRIFWSTAKESPAAA